VRGARHAVHERLATAIAWMQAEGAERIVHVGDVADGAGDLPRTLAILAEYGIEGVAGNHDRWLLAGQMRELRGAHPASALTAEVERALRLWPPLLSLHTVRGELLLCHGVGRDDMLVLKGDTILGFLTGQPAFEELLAADHLALVVAGHTHQPSVRRVGHLIWINAGTLKGDDFPVATLVDVERGEVCFAGLEEPHRVGAREVLRFPR
jgi:predicted phosphodiesterase